MAKLTNVSAARAQHRWAILLTLLATAFLIGSHLYDYAFGLSHPKLRASISALDLVFEAFLLVGLALLAVGLQRSHAALAGLNAVIEARVRERTRQLELANRELETFTYSVSHDLRAPLRRIHGFAEIIHDQWPPGADPQLTDCLRRIRQSVARMGDLIEDLLRLSRITRQAIRRVPVDLSAVASSVADEIRQGQPARSVALSVAAGMSVLADTSLTRVIFENLLGNAWKFTSKTPDARIEVGHAEREGGPVFYVRDNGAGFDPQFADRLFGVFQRLHRESDFPGTGVGLAVVKRIVERHGGSIWAESQSGKGATFYFSLQGADGPPAAQHP